MKIAVMVAAYNAERHIEAALGSLLSQRADAELDIIVVNDGSTDATPEIVKRLAEAAPEIRLIETPNQGITRTRNVMLDAIAPDTDLVTTLDSDDLSPPGRFAREQAPFAADPTLEMSYGYMLVFRGEGDDPVSPDFDGKTARVRGIHLGAMLARTALMRRTGRFDESFVQAEDTDFLFRLLESDPKLLLRDETSYYYRRHDNNISRDPSIVRREFARALMASSRRRRAGLAKGIPPNFFDHDDQAIRGDWY
ncbi:MAG: glycosyltransferase family A protein [Devosia sp.]